MKKCNGCNKEIDKYAIACDYCGKIDEERAKTKKDAPKVEAKGTKKKDGEE